MTKLGEVIREARLRAGMNLSDVMRRTGVQVSIISKIEKGETKFPEDETLEKLAPALGLSVDYLIDVRAESTKRRAGAEEADPSPALFPATPADAGGVATPRDLRAGARADRDVAVDELAPAGFVTRAEFDRMYGLLLRVAKRVGVSVVAAICVMFGPSWGLASETPGSPARGEYAFNVPYRLLRRARVHAMARLRDWTRSLAPRQRGHAPALVDTLAWAS